MVQLTLYVNPASGKDTNAGNSATPLKTLTRALQLAQSGATIQLGSGIYNAANSEKFPLTLPAGVMVLGNESNKGKGIVIEGSGEYASPTLGKQNITLRLETDAQLRGVTVINRATNGTGVWIESTSPVVANNTLTTCTREGILVTGTGKPAILDNLFVQNVASGLSLVRNAKGEIRRNQFEKTGNGITLSDQAAPLVSDNNVVANRNGIILSQQVRPVLRRNLIEKNTKVGLVVIDQAQPHMGSQQDPAGNILRDNGEVDWQNSTQLTLVSSGNQVNPARCTGSLQFVAAQGNTTNFTLGPAQFSDIAGHWAEPFIQRLVTRGLISGFPDGNFRPEAKIARAEYAALIAKTFDLPTRRDDTNTFTDVPASFWAAPAIQKAYKMGFISGFPDNTFRPAQNLTRVQAIASVVSGLGLTGGNPSLLTFYSDRAQIPSYATDIVATATQQRLIVNYPQPNQLEPMRDMTRAEVATLIYQALVATGKAEAIASPYVAKAEPYLPTFTDLQGHWAENFIRRLAAADLISGFADGSFKPEVPLNRAQYAALIVKAFNPTFKRPPAQFTDIPTDFWASSVIQQADRGAFLAGFPDNTFRPQQNVQRVQLILSLVNGLGLPAGNEKLLDRYQDRDAIPAYARSAVAAATQQGIIVNYPKLEELDPNRDATRAEAAAMLYQALVAIGRLSAINSPYIISVLSR